MGLFGAKRDPEDMMYDAMALMDKNQPKGAISLFSKVLKVQPNNTRALFNKGLALNLIKKHSDAVTCFEKLIELTQLIRRPKQQGSPWLK